MAFYYDYLLLLAALLGIDDRERAAVAIRRKKGKSSKDDKL